jgi:hypothetical protein
VKRSERGLRRSEGGQHFNGSSPLPPLNAFDIVTALVLALPYLFALGRSYRPQPGAFEAAVGCAIGLAAAN